MIAETKYLGGSDARSISASGRIISPDWRRFYSLRGASAGLYVTLEDVSGRPPCYLGAYVVIWIPSSASYGLDVKNSSGTLVRALAVGDLCAFYLGVATSSSPWDRTTIGSDYAWIARPMSKTL